MVVSAQDAGEVPELPVAEVGCEMMDPDAPVRLFTRFWDWLTYRPWTDAQLAERVAKSVANTSYRINWGRPVEPGTPVCRFSHHFEFLSDEEIAEQERMRTLHA